MNDNIKTAIRLGETSLGIELGSTRIKAVLIDENHTCIATGGHNWENRLENGLWTYHLDDVWEGLQNCFRDLADDVRRRYEVELTTVGALGFSAMMHGYLPFGAGGAQLAEFRTWRNTITGVAAQKLTAAFSFSIPQRWSIAHLYQAMLNGEEHVGELCFLTTLAGYVHWKLTGQKVLGVGDASGVFPIDSATGGYDAGMMDRFDKLAKDMGMPWKLADLLPRVLAAGENAGALTEEGARLLDPTGRLVAGIPLCPPEGDAGTGMVATNSVAPRTGNVSAGTSIFAMIVLEKQLSRYYPEIDMVTTPSGSPVAMVHCNNCSTELDAWVRLFGEAAEKLGAHTGMDELYGKLYREALKGDADAGGLLSYNYHSGEHITGFEQGRPLFARTPDSRFTLANFMRANLYSAMATLKIGMDILTEKENVHVDQMLGHGGLFKTQGVAQRLMAGALNVPVAVMASAGEGGAWGVALLAAYMRAEKGGMSLEEYLAGRVFAANDGACLRPVPDDVCGFAAFMHRYTEGLAIERAAVEYLS